MQQYRLDRVLDRERTLAAAHELLPNWVALLLVAAIAWQLARIAWMLVPAAAVGDPVASRPAGAGATAAAGGVDVQSIAAAHLFGKADPAVAAAPAPRQELHENLAETRLNLLLKGTIAASGADSSLAIIAAQGQDEKLYAVGDAVVPGTTLHAVYPDRVILNTGGALEALKLPREFPEGGPANIRRSVPTASEAPAPDPTPSIQQVVTENVTQLADVIRPTPYFVGGEQQGYRVYPGRDRKQFAALGLRPGDLIKSVNGASLTDPQQAMEIFQSLGEADQVTVTVERNGQPQVLTLSTSQLTLDDEQ
ncbi:MAG TPA: type II secretion system protein GspC [Woeseiaceae bacterium]|nr:type II secretion system protein GspC [Woeseiaceae bacterium]